MRTYDPDPSLTARTVPASNRTGDASVGLATPDRPALAVHVTDEPARTVANAAHLLLAYVLPRLFTQAAIIIAARVLGVARFGAYGTAAAFAVILSILATLGMMPLLVRDIARAPERAAELIGAAHIMKVATTAVMCVCSFAIATIVFDYPQPIVAAILLLGLAHAVYGFRENVGAHFQAIERMGDWMQSAALTGFVGSASAIGLLFLTNSYVGFCAGVVIGEVAGFGWLLRRAPHAVRVGSGASARAAGQLARELVPFGAAFIALTLYSKVDVLLLAHWRTTADVGTYTAAYKFIDVTQALAIVGVAAAFPRLSRLAPRDRAPQRWAGTRAIELALLASVPAAATLWLVREPLVQLLFGTEYAAAAPVVMVLAPAIPALALNIVGGYLLAAVHRMGHVALLYGAALVVKVGINALLVPQSGAAGAATAMLIAELALCCAMVLLLSRAAAAAPALRVVVTCGCAAIASALIAVFTNGGWTAALACMSVMAALYGFSGVLRAELALLRVVRT